jgi:hypothetical protein
MGNRSKVTAARLRNLVKPSERRELAKLCQTDLSDSDGSSECHAESEYSEIDGLSDSEIEIDEDEIREEAELLAFAEMLRTAQEVANEVEKKNPRKWKRVYTGNSERTKRRHAEKRRKLEAQGIKSVKEWFLQVKHSAPCEDSESDGEDMARIQVSSVPLPVSEIPSRNKLY